MTERFKSEAISPPDERLLASRGIDPKCIGPIATAMTALLADVFAVYIKTKNFHWHMHGPHFRDLHLLLDEQGDQLFAMTDPIAERVRKIGGTTLRSIGQITRLQHIADNDSDFVTADDMMRELLTDNLALVLTMRTIHTLCEDAGDVASASVLENWIDETQRRAWFLSEIVGRS